MSVSGLCAQDAQIIMQKGDFDSNGGEPFTKKDLANLASLSVHVAVAALTGGASLSLEAAMALGGVTMGLSYSTYHAVEGTPTTVEGHAEAILGGAALAGVGHAVASKTQPAVENANAVGGGGKLVNSADDVTFNQRSIDKAFGKHATDFGKYPDGSNASVELFKSDLKNLINTGIQKRGTWYGTQGTHIYDPITQQWAFINSDGTFNTAFKLSADQFKYLIETGVVR